ncbi:hypothetical protein ACVOMV_15360 [Mesorhizobium atlanticum]
MRQSQGGKLQAGRPAFGLVVERHRGRDSEVEAADIGKIVLGLLERKAQVAVAEADHMSLHLHMGKLERQLAAGREHDAQGGRRIGDQHVDAGGYLAGDDQMRIVENEVDRRGATRQLVDNGGEDGIDRRHRAGVDQRFRVAGNVGVHAVEGGGEIFEEAGEIVVQPVD